MLKKFMSYSKKNTILLLLVVPVASLIEISVAQVLRIITDTATGKIDVPYNILIIGVLGYIVADSITYFISSYIKEKWINEITTKTRSALIHSSLSESSSGTFKETSSSYNAITNNINVFQDDYLRSISNLYMQGWQFVIAVLMSLMIQPYLCIIVIIMCVPSILTPFINQKLLKRSRKNAIQASEQYTTILKNILDGLSTIHLFNISQIMQNQFDQKNQSWLKKQNIDQWNRKIIGGISQLLDSFLYLGTWVVGIYFVMNHSISLGGLVGFSQLIIFVSEPLQQSTDLFTNYVGGNEVAKGLFKDISAKNSTKHKTSILSPLTSIKYHSISFARGKNTVLSNINVTFDAKKHYLVVGKTGSGKSTLLKLPLLNMGRYNGELVINQTITNYAIPELRKHVGVAEQGGYIFTDTLRNNLTFKKTSYSNQQLIALLKQVQLTKFASKQGLDLQLSNNGQQLSGGERKRLLIARALLQPSEYLFFDEPTTGLDPKTGEKIEEMLMKLNKGWVTITHRYNKELFNFVDEIIVIDKGKLIGKGSAKDPHIITQLEQLNLL